MRTIFDGLVEEFRAWHLFEQPAGNPPQRELRDFPGMSGSTEYGGAGYFDRAPQYDWDLDEAAPRPGSPR